MTLAKGEYQQRVREHTFQFGTAAADQDTRWRELFGRVNRVEPGSIQATLAALLGDVDRSPHIPPAALFRAISAETWPTPLDWRYYLVTYDEMRRGRSGRYYSDEPVLGYGLCMLDSDTRRGFYSDPFLSAIVSVVKPDVDLAEPRFRWGGQRILWLPSGHGVRCVPEGLEVTVPDDNRKVEAAAALQAAGAEPVDNRFLLRMQQTPEGLDLEDRVQRGAALVRLLVLKSN